MSANSKLTRRRKIRPDGGLPIGPSDTSRSGWQPWLVLDLDFADTIESQLSERLGAQRWGGVWLLLRVFEEPVGMLRLKMTSGELHSPEVAASVPEHVNRLIRDRLQTASADGMARNGAQALPSFLATRTSVLRSGPELTAVVCTRDQPEGLAKCLSSLQAQSYRRAEVLVVDNASTTDAARSVVEKSVGPLPVRYVYEPRAGLSRARNRSLEEASTELIAWIDDDETADPHWLCEIAGGFLRHPTASAVCGVMIPAELVSQPQFWFEEYGGHSKGRGFEPSVFSQSTRDLHNPLFPLPPFGTGGNMAMRVPVIRKLGGFDCALGAGTRAMGAEDTRALTNILLDSGTVVYQPTAVTRHYHRRDYTGLRRQLYGYGSGLSAFYTSLLLDHPTLLVPLLRLLPQAMRTFRDPNGARLAGISEEFPRDLLREHRKGMLRGPFEYLRERLAR